MALLNVTMVILPQLLLQEDWEQSGVFKGEEKRELLFRVFKHLALGGPVNQVCGTSFHIIMS